MRGFGLLVGLLLVLYPLLIYLGIHWLEPAVLGLVLVLLYMVRVLIRARSPWQRGLILLAGVALGALLWYANSELLLRLLPAGINLALAVYFGFGLVYPPTLPTRIAALQHGVPLDELPPPIWRYTTGITRMWMSFFLFNASVSAFTALVGSRELWALYNGLIAYGLVGVLFAAEYAYRRLIFFKKHGL